MAIKKTLNAKAVVFDMDGLLVDTEPLWKQADIDLIGFRGGVFKDEVRNQIIGLRGDDVVAHFKKVYGFSDPVEELQDELINRMVDLIQNGLEPMPGAGDLLFSLQRMGIPCALASSSAEILIDTVLEKMGWDAYFQYRCSADTERQGKPAPDVYLSACRLLGEPPANCLALEDSLNGALAAVAAGMECLVVPSSGVYPDPRFDRLPLQQVETLELVQTAFENSR